MQDDVRQESVRIERVTLKNRLFESMSRYFTFEVAEAMSWVGGFIHVADEEHKARINGVRPGHAVSDPESHRSDDSRRSVAGGDRL
jgi:hypothetical protein